MKRLLLLAALAALCLIALSSCSTQPSCETYQYGFLTINNTSLDPYDIHINGIYEGQLPGGYQYELERMDVGLVNLQARQAEGFLFFPTTRNQQAYISACERITWSIP